MLDWAFWLSIGCNVIMLCMLGGHVLRVQALEDELARLDDLLRWSMEERYHEEG
jgi:hypothetical protein